MHDSSILDAREAIHEPEQSPALVEGTGGNTPDALRDLENARRHDVGELVPPRFPLQGDAGAELVQCAEGPDINHA
jgi:hypothetical protein